MQPQISVVQKQWLSIIAELCILLETVRLCRNKKDFDYATDIAFEDVCDTVVQLMDSIL